VTVPAAAAAAVCDAGVTGAPKLNGGGVGLGAGVAGVAGVGVVTGAPKLNAGVNLGLGAGAPKPAAKKAGPVPGSEEGRVLVLSLSSLSLASVGVAAIAGVTGPKLNGGGAGVAVVTTGAPKLNVGGLGLGLGVNLGTGAPKPAAKKAGPVPVPVSEECRVFSLSRSPRSSRSLVNAIALASATASAYLGAMSVGGDVA
jgi:hypothetical protein